MEAVPLNGPKDASMQAEADVCPKCGGVFLEFFDGEPSAVSRRMLGRRKHAPGPVVGVGSACPDCSTPMTRKAYLGQGPELARCDECLAVFIAESELPSLANLELAPEPAAHEPTWIAKLLAWLPR
jgi:Zn-finger nucleic acid-binding protein